ncbi:MAG: histidine phosphatase family protein [Chloroflexi bacterium]|nr:histidine phosphatase family protein [Chloroflexota bacterium]
MASPTSPRGLIPAGLNATVVMLRHGESTWVAEGRFQGQGDPPLSSEGLRQAELAAVRFAEPAAAPALPVPGRAPLEIRHSPLARTATTATLVADAIRSSPGAGAGMTVIADPRFLEIGQGEWEGRLATEIEDRWAELLAGWRRDPLTAWAPGGESLPDVDRRVRASLADSLRALASLSTGPATHGSQVLGYGTTSGAEPWSLIVGHDGVFKVALLALLDVPLTRFWLLPFALCGISVVEIRAGRARLRAHNITEHLGPLETARRRDLDAERSRSGAL